MGFKVSWIASRGDTAALLASAGVERTEERHEFAEEGLYLLSLQSPSPWRFLVAMGWDHLDRLSEAIAATASKGSEALFFVALDTTMDTQLVAYRDGRELWSIAYSPDGEGLHTTGDLPSLARPLIDAAIIDQTEADRGGGGVDLLYDVPASIARAITGFRHDLDPVSDESEPFVVLR